MTNEQVIINKIDVSECEHLTETRHCKAQMAVMGTDANRCKCFPNCHYKQLVREKEECEKLKKQYNCYACDTCNGKEDYIQLKKHCENAIKALHNKQAELNRLKADNKQLKEELSKVYEDIKLSPLCYKCDEEECLQKEINQLKADNEQLQVKEQECLTLINKVNRLEEEKNTLQILLEGKNSQYNAIKQEYEKLKKGTNNE